MASQVFISFIVVIMKSTRRNPSLIHEAQPAGEPFENPSSNADTMQTT